MDSYTSQGQFGATLVVNGVSVAQYISHYNSGRDPMPDGGHWRPFNPRYRTTSPYTQICQLTRAQVSADHGVPLDVLAAFEHRVTAEALDAARADAARIEQGRVDWARLSQEQRDALNDYALRTEGHTID